MPQIKSAISLLILLITGAYLYHTRFTAIESLTNLTSPGSTATMASSAILSNLSISLRQTTSRPPTLAITVKNNNSVPVTILTWDSPLDPLALQLGAISITPSDSTTPLDIPTIQVSRKMPPGAESLVEIGAGETSDENVVELKEFFLGTQLRELKVETATVRCKGRWRAVWTERKGELGPGRIEKMGAGGEAAEGDFESAALDLVLK